VSYRDDEAARDERARALIDEIAGLERDQIAAAAAERRLEDARRELATLRSPAAPPAAPAALAAAEPARPPSLATHVVVFCATAGAAFAGYTLLF
jgi:cytochrome c-type biogenesis protein CcmH/NrfG